MSRVNNCSRDLELKHLKKSKQLNSPQFQAFTSQTRQSCWRSLQVKCRDLEGFCCEEPVLPIPQAEHHMLLAFPGEKNSERLLPTPQRATGLSWLSVGLSNEMQFNKPGPSMLNLWTTDADVSPEKEPVVLSW